MGFFSNLFGKQKCCVCGQEVGPMKRDKIKNKEYLCSDCKRNCSMYVRVSEMDKETVERHMKFMENRDKVFREVIEPTGGVIMYPSMKCDADRIDVYKACGMLAIYHKKNPQNKNYTEVIRFDEIEDMEPYEETTNGENNTKVFKEAGVKLKLFNEKSASSMSAKDSINNNPHVHPFINREIKLVFTHNEKEKQPAEGFCTYMAKSVFGVDDDRSRFFSMSKNEKAKLQAGVDMANLIGSAIKAQKDGETDPEAIKEQFEKAQDSTNRANLGRISDYSKLADEIFAKYPEA